MTETSAQPARPVFGLGGVLTGTFQVYASRFPFFFAVVFVPYLATQLVMVYGINRGHIDPFAAGALDPARMGYFLVAGILSTVIALVVLMMIQAVLARSAVSLKLGQGVQFQAAMRAALLGVIPIILLSLITGLAVVIGFVFLIVPGLYLIAMFYVMVPAIVFENRGFAGLSRSIDLTEGYRWPIVGLVVIVMIMGLIAGAFVGVVMSVIFGVSALATPDTLGTLTSPVYILTAIVLDAIINAVVLPIGMISAGLSFARLREIKEGGASEDLLKVFE